MKLRMDYHKNLHKQLLMFDDLSLEVPGYPLITISYGPMVVTFRTKEDLFNNLTFL